MTKKNKPYVEPKLKEVSEDVVIKELEEGQYLVSSDVSNEPENIVQVEPEVTEDNNVVEDSDVEVEKAEEVGIDPDFEGSDEEGSIEPYSEATEEIQSEDPVAEEAFVQEEGEEIVQEREETIVQEEIVEEHVEEASQEAPEVPVESEEDEVEESIAEAVEEAPAASNKAVEPPKKVVVDFRTKADKEFLPDDELLALAREKAAKPFGNWSRKVCEDLVEHGIYPQTTTRGNFVSDTTRAKNLNALTPTEYLDFVEGQIPTSSEEEEELFWRAVSTRFKLNGKYSREQIRDAAVYSKHPETTPEGVIIHDATREELPLDLWVYQDVRAALLGEITTSIRESALVGRLRQLLCIGDNYPKERLLSTLGKEKTGLMSVLVIEAKLREYKAARSKGVAAIGDSNAMLLREIRNILKLEYAEFRECWVAVLNFVKAEEFTIFADSVRYQGWAHVPLKGKDLTAITDLLTLFHMSVQPEYRAKGIEQQVVLSLIEHLCVDDLKEKILTFYAR